MYGGMVFLFVWCQLNYLVVDHQLYTDVKLESARRYVQYMHRAGEDTGIGSSDADLVTISLVSHELPQAATKIYVYVVDTVLYVRHVTQWNEIHYQSISSYSSSI